MSNDSTPNLKESLLETAIDQIPSNDAVINDPDISYRSKLLREHYDSANEKCKDSMDLFCMALTGFTLDAIIKKNDEINLTNKNVG